MTDKILPCLVGLGTTADDVAATLRSQRIRARPHDTSHDNPIVRFLNRTLDLGARLEILDGDHAIIVQQSGSWMRIPLPDAVVGFLRRFDAGDYPDLELSR